MSDIENLAAKVQGRFQELIQHTNIAFGELSLEIAAHHLREVCHALRCEQEFKFELLIDIAGVDYLNYGLSEWVTEKATSSGFERGVETNPKLEVISWEKPRFAVVYHLLSIEHNQRIRLRVFVDNDSLLIPSIVDIWAAANWYEREAFDLYGILFDGHPDLRRILTDYGFIGHPFRKDFPLSGNVEVRYDAALQRVIYEPVDIVPRILVPKVIREQKETEGQKNG